MQKMLNISKGFVWSLERNTKEEKSQMIIDSFLFDFATTSARKIKHDWHRFS